MGMGLVLYTHARTHGVDFTTYFRLQSSTKLAVQSLARFRACLDEVRSTG